MRGVPIDWVGKKIGMMTVLRRDDSPGIRTRWICRCDCGKEKSISSSNIPHTKSCGCLHTAYSDLTGKHYGRWTVLRRVSAAPRLLWECQCECGQIRNVEQGNLNRGLSISCGCLKAEKATKHGFLKKNNVEGRDVYRLWHGMLDRCYNKNSYGYKNYGGRGINADDFRYDFKLFYEHIGPRPSPQHQIDRINNDGSYSIGNVKWSTPEEQAFNRRSSFKITCWDRTQCLSQWAEEVGIPPQVIVRRIEELGWTPEQALTKPVSKRKNNRKFYSAKEEIRSLRESLETTELKLRVAELEKERAELLLFKKSQEGKTDAK